MSFISSVFNTVFYKPLLNGLIFLIGILPFHDVGIAVIILTLFVRFLIFPLTHRAIVTQIKVRELEPEIKQIKEKFKKDMQEQSKRTMELYRKHGINPFSGFINLMIQIPIIFALYKVFVTGINFDYSLIYSFITIPENINIIFLGLFDMTQKNYILAFITGASQFIQMRLAIPPVKVQREDFASRLNTQMRYTMPIIVFFVVSRFSSAIAIYWTTMNIFAIIHELIVRKKAKKITNKNGETKDNHQINYRAGT